MIKAGIIGATGYGGRETVRILLNHPGVEIVLLAAGPSIKGRRIDNVYPEFRGRISLPCPAVDVGEFMEKCDVVFMATPDGLAMEYAPALLKGGLKVIDYAADFRFKDVAVYEKNYPLKHTERELLGRAVYGLPEFNASQIAGASLIGNPGCFATAVILGAAPLFQAALVADDFVAASCLSGTSGAGRKPNQPLLVSEMAGNVRPYKVACHRHQPEMEQALGQLSDRPARVCFIPHVIPIDRGIIATMPIGLSEPTSLDQLLELYNRTYAQARFVRVSPAGELPELKTVANSNYCDIGLALDDLKRTVVVISCIDNLLKGLAGQAVQNMNIMFGLDEGAGLD